MDVRAQLKAMRDGSGTAQTVGLSDDTIDYFVKEDPTLKEAIDRAYQEFLKLEKSQSPLLKLAEKEVLLQLQSHMVNFYPELQINPYVPLATEGPWIVSLHGAVIHDSGGYGMLGFGHNPKEVLAHMNRPHVMANVMTASLIHGKVTNRLMEEIGHKTPKKDPPFTKFLFMNSGSESVTVAMRIADLHAGQMKKNHSAIKSVKLLAHKGGFHGRTDRPSQASDSSMYNYKDLASFVDRHNLWTIEPGNLAQLREAFLRAEKEQVFIEMVLLEPVMGEGNPGVGLKRDFYDEARSLTKKHQSLLLIDSIQAGLRTHGVLSIVDYPGFEGIEPPDFETFSKALNAGQYPLSVLAMTDHAASLYRRGIYGNTMTANPRALDVALSVFDLLTPEVRQNIQKMGEEFLKGFFLLKEKYPDAITHITGTGLLCALHLNEHGYQVVGQTGMELWLREQGIGVIHGGKNALRFTPHFRITPQEVQLIMRRIDEALQRGPVYHKQSE